MPTPFDLILIGGGINGCAVARLAAKNSYSVALFEKNDFGSGVTSRSTRLIHGGLRYLEKGHVGLVRESLHDRRELLRDYPGQVVPQPFLIPIYESDSRSPWYIHLGLWAYSLLARGSELPSHRRLSAAGAAREEPGLDREGLRAAFVYYDCQAVYPERLALEMALEAEQAGAEIRNHTPVTGLLTENGRVAGVEAGGEEFRARLVINAGGAWVDQVLALSPHGGRRRMISLLNGAHIVVPPFPGAPKHALYHEARSDKRPFFIIPWRDLYLIGTTETPFDGDPDRVAPTGTEVEYLLREAAFLLPEAGLSRDDVLYAYEGSRPLLRSGSGDWNSASRDHLLYDHAKREGLEGMLTMAGGKLTTARSFAREVMRAVSRKLDRGMPADPPSEPPSLDGGDPRLARLYGRRLPEFHQFAAREAALDHPIAPGAPVTAAQLIYAIRREKARTLGDMLLRRTGLAFDAGWRDEWAEAAACIAAKEFGWTPERKAAELDAWREEFRRTLVRV